MSETATSAVARARRIETIAVIERFAEQEARAARLPGWTNGPADAYRHLIVVGEMRRRFGPVAATLSAEGNEFASWLAMIGAEMGDREVSISNRPASRAMDRYNNWHVAPALGRAADGPEAVVANARRAIERAASFGGSGHANTAYWLPRSQWVNDGPSDNWPSPDWPDLSQSAAIREYRRKADMGDPACLPADIPTPPDDAGGGPVHVRPHQREGHPVQGYQRSAPAR